MSIDLSKVKERLAQFDAKQKKSPPQMSMAPGFSYTTPLFVGDVDSRIRTWLDNVNDKDSLIVLNGAIDSFLCKSKDNHFRFTVKRSSTNGNDIVEVEGNIVSWDLANDWTSVHNCKVEFQLKSYIAQPSIEYEIRNNCYFYLNGEIEGESHSGKGYNPTQDIFEDHTSNIITKAEFTSLSVWCERRSFKQELLTTVPF